MKLHTFACALLLTAGCVKSSEPPIGYYPNFKIEPFLRRAAALQAMGRDAACKSLLAGGGGDDVILLCRLLFVRRGASEFRRPLIGAPVFLADTEVSDWPLEPVELIDGVPIVITIGYILGGEPEPASSYLKYCMANCDWSPVRYADITRDQVRDAMSKLFASPKWKRPLTQFERDFLAAQAK